MNRRLAHKLLSVASFFFSFSFFLFRVNSIHSGRQGSEANRLTSRLASTRADNAPRQPPGSGPHSKVPTAFGSGGHSEVPTAPGFRGLLEVPTSPGSGGHLDVPTAAGSKCSRFPKYTNAASGSLYLEAAGGGFVFEPSEMAGSYF
jgi:hypothetical protein